MRKSITLLLQPSLRAPRTIPFLLVLLTTLTTNRPVLAQREGTSPPAIHSPVYTGYAKAVAPPLKEAPGEVSIPVRITPNPSSGSFCVRLYGSPAEQVCIEILDGHGRLIDTRLVSASAGLRFGYWYPPGTYFLHIIQGNRHRKIKLVKVAG